MALPNLNNSYNFDKFLEWRKKVDYYANDPFLQKTLKYFSGSNWEEADAEARKISKKASFRWRDMAEAISRPEKQPSVMHYDGHHHRIDRIVRPFETAIMEKEIFGERLFSNDHSLWVKLIRMLIIYQNSDACIICPITCTEGLVAILRKYADTPETKRILQHCTGGIDGEFAIGAQYLSEIQGGSDLPANLLEAVKEGDAWRLYGTKFFCSATHADYALVTAKPNGSEKVALFVVPSWLPGNKEKEIRNGFTIDRLKWKMGTSELPTSELTFNGAVAYPLGPLDRGIANVVGVVLTYSRLTVALNTAAMMIRAHREAKRYSEMREAFGCTIGSFPFVKMQIQDIEKYAQRTTAGAFKLYQLLLSVKEGPRGGIGGNDESLEIRKKHILLRELVMLQKVTASWDGPNVIRKAISIFGGHGVIEDFSSLPRFYRDAAVNELWEGPRNVLLTQIHRDLQRVSDWYSPDEFVKDALTGADPVLIEEYSEIIEQLVSHPSLIRDDEKTMDVCCKWDDFCHRFYHSYQDLSLAEIM